jgi:multimeric flavodoxin WrbA
MKALILNGSARDDNTLVPVEKVITEKLRSAGWDVTSMLLKEQKIAGCRGCFGCWLKTPGVCVIADDGRRIAREIIQSDLLVLLSPVTFGGYSSELKKAMDRMIPDIMPYFRVIRGEMHHVPRYAKYPDLVTVGTMPSDDLEAAETFVRLGERNAINFYCHNCASGIVMAGDSPGQVDSKVAGLLKKAEAIA